MVAFLNEAVNPVLMVVGRADYDSGSENQRRVGQRLASSRFNARSIFDSEEIGKYCVFRYRCSRLQCGQSCQSDRSS